MVSVITVRDAHYPTILAETGHHDHYIFHIVFLEGFKFLKVYWLMLQVLGRHEIPAQILLYEKLT